MNKQQQFALHNERAPRPLVEPYLNKYDFVRKKMMTIITQHWVLSLKICMMKTFFLEGNIIFIDPVIYLETTEMALSKNVLFKFPF